MNEHMDTAVIRKTWAGHTTVEQLCDALEAAWRERHTVTRVAVALGERLTSLTRTAGQIERERNDYAALLLVAERERDVARAENRRLEHDVITLVRDGVGVAGRRDGP